MMPILVSPVKILEIGFILKEADESINVAEENTVMQRYAAGGGFLLTIL
jgi:hypothetical protein